ncbi:MAG: S46 family peptidase, partial [Bacteroidales bacterium]|nr:S46 family peptidase [Bacteroidales bacterium]
IDIEALKKEARDFYKDYNAETDKKIVKATLKLYKNEVEQQFHPEFFTTINKKFKGDMDKYVDYIFKKSIFVDSSKLYSFLNKYSLKVLEKDPAFQAAMSINKLYSSINKETKNNRNDFNYGRYLYMAGLIAKNDNNVLYPDANFTMRFTYGSVQDYFPKDAVYYNYYTTLTGVMEKEDPNNWEFVVPEKLKQLYMDKDYGQYGEKGILKTCFLTNNDITGGNSGSPVLNGKGELIGLAFDGNWEAMSGDIAFEPELQRCINVDIRYILFIIDKFAGAKHIIDEMTIIK